LKSEKTKNTYSRTLVVHAHIGLMYCTCTSVEVGFITSRRDVVTTCIECNQITPY